MQLAIDEPPEPQMAIAIACPPIRYESRLGRHGPPTNWNKFLAGKNQSFDPN